MATRKQAELARVQCSEPLRKLGAHSFEVRAGSDYGLKGHVLVANVASGQEAGFPQKVTVGKASVPVVVQRKSRFTAE